MQAINQSIVFRFNRAIPDEEWPAVLNNPLGYDVPPLCLEAAEILKEFIQNLPPDLHQFRKTDLTGACGKMFGVLLIEDAYGEKGFIAAFSGRLGNTNMVNGFVPPVYDLLNEDGFFRKGELELNRMNQLITDYENEPLYQSLLEELKTTRTLAAENILNAKNTFIVKKNKRHITRKSIDTSISEIEKNNLLKTLEQESRNSHREYKQATAHWQHKIKEVELKLQEAEAPILALKAERKQFSSALQEKLFSEYAFLNQYGELKDLKTIFENEATAYPPSGAGECCAPRLFQYAYLHHYKPKAIAEFWWGDSPVTEIRHEGNFYPACKGKCEPILKHMLQDIPLDQNKEANRFKNETAPEIVFEDLWFLAIHKHENMLSVPGKLHEESILQILRKLNPSWSDLIAAHRLDMATSGILLFAKNMEAYKLIQRLFISRDVKKRYVALLSKAPAENSGTIGLPLKSDYYNRPRQMVCLEEGKSAITHYKVIESDKGVCKVHFFPVTGRTHQLRVHAAHHLGLNAPIVGDDLYGLAGNRLFLHAEQIEFVHPFTNELTTIERKADF